MSFRLYPNEAHWWSFADYGHVVATVERLRPTNVLEFGPGSSTLALIEGGAAHVDTCEDDEHWSTIARERIAAKFPQHVDVHDYRWSDPVHVAVCDDRRYDLGLIDGPQSTERRACVIRYALERCKAVLVPTEEDAYGNGIIRGFCEDIGDMLGKRCKYTHTGPLAGGFVLFQ